MEADLSQPLTGNNGFSTRRSDDFVTRPQVDDRAKETLKAFQKEQETQIYNNIRARTVLEEENKNLSQRLYHSDETITIKVRVPKGYYGGQFMKLQIQGRRGFQILQIPPGLRQRDWFVFVASKKTNLEESVQYIRLRIPDGVYENQSFGVSLPSGSRISVIVPPGLSAGDYVEVPMENSLMGQETTSQGSREEFLSALPEDIRREIMEQESLEERLTEGTFEVTTPLGLASGDSFDAVLPGGQVTPVRVPHGVVAGQKFGIQTFQRDSNYGMDPNERENFLAALPEDIRAEFSTDGAEDISFTQEEIHPVFDIFAQEHTENLLDMDTTDMSHTEERDFFPPQSEVLELLGDPIDVHESIPGPKTDSSDPFETCSDVLPASDPTISFGSCPDPKPKTVTSDTFESCSDILPVTNTTDSSNSLESLSSSTASISSEVNKHSKTSPLEKLKQAKSRLDQGEISQEAFNEIKKEVIASI